MILAKLVSGYSSTGDLNGHFHTHPVARQSVHEQGYSCTVLLGTTKMADFILKKNPRSDWVTKIENRPNTFDPELNSASNTFFRFSRSRFSKTYVGKR